MKMKGIMPVTMTPIMVMVGNHRVIRLMVAVFISMTTIITPTAGASITAAVITVHTGIHASAFIIEIVFIGPGVVMAMEVTILGPLTHPGFTVGLPILRGFTMIFIGITVGATETMNTNIQGMAAVIQPGERQSGWPTEHVATDIKTNSLHAMASNPTASVEIAVDTPRPIENRCVPSHQEINNLG